MSQGLVRSCLQRAVSDILSPLHSTRWEAGCESLGTVYSTGVQAEAGLGIVFPEGFCTGICKRRTCTWEERKEGNTQYVIKRKYPSQKYNTEKWQFYVLFLCSTQESLQMDSSECCANILINNLIKQSNKSVSLASDPPCDYTQSFIFPDAESKAMGISLQNKPPTSRNRKVGLQYTMRISVLCILCEDGLNLEASQKTSQGSKPLHGQEVWPTVYNYPIPVVYDQELWSVPVVRSTE